MIVQALVCSFFILREDDGIEDYRGGDNETVSF